MDCFAIRRKILDGNIGTSSSLLQRDINLDELSYYRGVSDTM
jgi:hypothetical protein